jgi:hypothetical protein
MTTASRAIITSVNVSLLTLLVSLPSMIGLYLLLD